MKKIRSGELYGHLSRFLKRKGIEFKEGSYTQRVEKSCSLLTDAINASQRGIERAKVGIDRNLDKMRQTIHEKTAPKPQTKATAAPAKTRKTRKPGKRTTRPKAASVPPTEAGESTA